MSKADADNGIRFGSILKFVSNGPGSRITVEAHGEAGNRLAEMGRNRWR